MPPWLRLRRSNAGPRRNSRPVAEARDGRAGRRAGSRGRQILRLVLAVVLPLSCGAAAVAGLYLAAGRAGRYLDDAAEFRVDRIEVSGNERFSDEEICERADLRTGESIFDVRTETARRRLLAEPWILRADIEKELPGTLRIVVAERRPQALLVDRDGMSLVAEDGTVFVSVDPVSAPDLPVLTGFDLTRRVDDPVGLADELAAAVRLLRLIGETGLPGGRTVAEINRTVRGGFDLLAEDGLLVHLGEGPYRDKLERLHRVADTLARGGKQPTEIHLAGTRRPDRVTIRLQASVAAP